MCSHRLAVAKLVLEFKEPLFSHSNQVTRQSKQELWEYIRQQAVAQGAIQYARKSWKEIRDCVWAPIRRDTMAKMNKARMLGEDTVTFTDIDKVVIEIIGSSGSGGLDDSTKAEFMQNDGEQDQMVQQFVEDKGTASSNPNMGWLNHAHSNDSYHSGNNDKEEEADEPVDTKEMPSLTQMLELFREHQPPHVIVGNGSQQNQPKNTGGGFSTSLGNRSWSIESTGNERRQQQGRNMNLARSGTAVGTSSSASAMAVQNSSNRQQLSVQQQNVQQNSLKRKFTDTAAPASNMPTNSASAVSSATNNGYKSDTEIEHEIKLAQLEQIKLQNTLLQEQIEEKRLQTRLLRIEVSAKEKKVAEK